MATYVLIPGASSDSWEWHLAADRLGGLGHRVVTVVLPCADESAGLGEYADAIEAAIDTESAGEAESSVNVEVQATEPPLILVAHSMGGLSAPLVCARRPVDLLILLAAMVPAPGETAGEWWSTSGQTEARRIADEQAGRAGDLDERALFFHDVPPALVAEYQRRPTVEQAARPFTEPWPLPAWPDVPTRFLLARDDRLFPAEFQRRIVTERLGFTPDEMDGGHMVALARPDELVDRLERYRAEAERRDAAES